MIKYVKSKDYSFDPMFLCLFLVANTFIVFGFICLFFVANTFIVFGFKAPLILTIYGHVAGNLNFFHYL